MARDRARRLEPGLDSPNPAQIIQNPTRFTTRARPASKTKPSSSLELLGGGGAAVHGGLLRVVEHGHRSSGDGTGGGRRRQQRLVQRSTVFGLRAETVSSEQGSPASQGLQQGAKGRLPARRKASLGARLLVVGVDGQWFKAARATATDACCSGGPATQLRVEAAAGAGAGSWLLASGLAAGAQRPAEGEGARGDAAEQSRRRNRSSGGGRGGSDSGAELQTAAGRQRGGASDGCRATVARRPAQICWGRGR
ncbi:alanine and glycine-rich protein-like [Eucalyptus grandis]|uniref:alanine and glycine-rich protein-like n=1 Tax=Eucalyptus grandis TaxID=71139 RepID=UPI00192EDF91|nr:alanine and glycine-rich protein-like [Eucalyptus grandis]